MQTGREDAVNRCGVSQSRAHGASLFTAQKATHQWIRRREENMI